MDEPRIGDELDKKRYQEVFVVDEYAIKGFFERYRYLSNFHVCPIWYEGLQYGSTEAAYQAAKHPECMRHMFLNISPSESKKLNSKLKLSPEDIQEFDKRKLEVMSIILLEKFRDIELRSLLLSTDDKYLEESNYWNDTYWGVCNGIGKNNLGKLLMNVRGYYKSLEEQKMLRFLR